ncbi:MAG TPA: hypothetical protein ENK38_02740 [Gammaproteobacteria bacterium]|nr:hypothetical protein [Gammaproteobacteria bacterium]
MKKIAYFAGGIAVAVSMATIAGSFTAPNTFTSGTTISSADMNANFAAVKTAVDDNDARITSLESGSACPSDMVSVGPICVDRYEATVENVATSAYVGDLATAALCNPNGNDCKGKIVARSVQGQIPTTSVTWFQAQQACAAAGKRLLTNAEWQMAAAGTPDDGTTCTVRGNTGAIAGCKSVWEVYDMVGNVNEWVADWIQGAPKHDAGGAPFLGTGSVESAFGSDAMAGVSPVNSNTTGANRSFLAAIYRGGRAGSTGQGVFAFYANLTPSESDVNLGFRCAK